MPYNFADLLTANRHVAESRRRIAQQRRWIAEQEGAGHDTRLSNNVLNNFEITLRSMVEQRDRIAREFDEISN